MPVIKDLSARKFVYFYRSDRSLDNPIDISRIMTKYPVLSYQFIQRKDFSCELRVKFLHSVNLPVEEEILGNIAQLFDEKIMIQLSDLELSGKKIVPFVSEIDINPHHSWSKK